MIALVLEAAAEERAVDHDALVPAGDDEGTPLGGPEARRCSVTWVSPRQLRELLDLSHSGLEAAVGGQDVVEAVGDGPAAGMHSAELVE